MKFWQVIYKKENEREIQFWMEFYHSTNPIREEDILHFLPTNQLFTTKITLLSCEEIPLSVRGKKTESKLISYYYKV